MALSERADAAAVPAKKDNPFVDLIINIAIPTVILSKMSSPERLGPVHALMLSMSFPLCFTIYKLVKDRKPNFFSIVGLISILLSGGLGLLKMDGFWFAVKEASVPSLFALAVLFSLRTKSPLIKTFLYNDNIIDVGKVNGAIESKNNGESFSKVISNATVMLSLSFFLSAVLNFGLAIYLLKSAAGTEEFNSELAKMHALSFPVISIPCLLTMALTFRYFVKAIEKLTDLKSDDFFKAK